jgi:Ulp1 family protease
MLRYRSTSPPTTTKSAKSKPKPLPKTFAFNTFFYSLLAQRGHAGVKRWTKRAKVNLFEMDRVLIPINKGNYHWILAVINVADKRIEYYDSMGREGVNGQNEDVLRTLRAYMVEEARAQNRPSEEIAKWTFHVPVCSPVCEVDARKRQSSGMDGIVGCSHVLLRNG